MPTNPFTGQNGDGLVVVEISDSKNQAIYSLRIPEARLKAFHEAAAIVLPQNPEAWSALAANKNYLFLIPKKSLSVVTSDTHGNHMLLLERKAAESVFERKISQLDHVGFLLAMARKFEAAPHDAFDSRHNQRIPAQRTMNDSMTEEFFMNSQGNNNPSQLVAAHRVFMPDKVLVEHWRNQQRANPVLGIPAQYTLTATGPGNNRCHVESASFVRGERSIPLNEVELQRLNRDWWGTQPKPEAPYYLDKKNSPKTGLILAL